MFRLILDCSPEHRRRGTTANISPPRTLLPLPASLSHGGGSSEVGEELEAEAHHKVPDVSGHLRAGNEDAPDEHHQDCVEGVADVPQPET